MKMDCVRTSSNESKGRKYETYRTVDGDVDRCRQECISDMKCKAWYYDDKCRLATDQNYKPDTRVKNSGQIVCQDDWSMLRLIWWVIILGTVLVGVWYLMRCHK
jgi:hypothetical protein